MWDSLRLPHNCFLWKRLQQKHTLSAHQSFVTAHNPHTSQFARKLARLSDFADLVEEAIASRNLAFTEEVAGIAETLSLEERGELFDSHAETFFELGDQLPTLLRYAVLTAADTAFEVYLNDTCHSYARVHKAPLALSDLRGSGVLRARDYLKKAAGLPFPDAGIEWQNVSRLHRLRNSIVHAEGLLPDSRADLIHWARGVNGLRIGPEGVIRLDLPFTAAATSMYEQFAAIFDRSCESAALWLDVFPIEDA